MKYLFLVVVSLLLSSCNLIEDYGSAETIDCSGIRENSINGPIVEGMSKCNLNYNEPIKLNSGGGNISEAIKIADRIGLNGSTVIVGDNCLSACVMLIAAAGKRDHCYDSLVAVHQGNTERATRRMVNYLYGQAIREKGWLADIIWSTPHDRLAILPYNTMFRMGLIDEIIECD